MVVVNGMCGCRVVSLPVAYVSSVLGVLHRKCPACLANVDFVTVKAVGHSSILSCMILGLLVPLIVTVAIISGSVSCRGGLSLSALAMKAVGYPLRYS